MPRGVDRYDEARLQGRLWTPRSLGGGTLKVWTDAQDGPFGYATGVSQWTDKSGSGNHLVQATGAAQMTLNRSYMNGRPALVNSGVQFLGHSSITVIAPYFVLLAFSTFSIQSSYARIWNAGLLSDTLGFFGMLDGQPSTFVGNGTTWNDFAANTPAKNITAGTIHVMAMHNMGAGGLQSYLNGLKLDAKVGSTTTATGFGLGAPYGGASTTTQEFVGGFHELLFWGSSPTQREIDLMIGATHWKWGAVGNLDASHPYKNRPPLVGD